MDFRDFIASLLMNSDKPADHTGCVFWAYEDGERHDTAGGPVNNPRETLPNKGEISLLHRYGPI